MKDSSESRGSSNQQDRGGNAQHRDDQSHTKDQKGQNDQMKGGQNQAPNKGGSGSGSSSGQPGGSRESEPKVMQHTSAGTTGTGSGQISPSTHHAQSTEKTSGGSQSGSGSDRDRK